MHPQHSLFAAPADETLIMLQKSHYLPNASEQCHNFQNECLQRDLEEAI